MSWPQAMAISVVNLAFSIGVFELLQFWCMTSWLCVCMCFGWGWGALFICIVFSSVTWRRSAVVWLASSWTVRVWARRLPTATWSSLRPGTETWCYPPDLKRVKIQILKSMIRRPDCAGEADIYTMCEHAEKQAVGSQRPEASGCFFFFCSEQREVFPGMCQNCHVEKWARDCLRCVEQRHTKRTPQKPHALCSLFVCVCVCFFFFFFWKVKARIKSGRDLLDGDWTAEMKGTDCKLTGFTRVSLRYRERQGRGCSTCCTWQLPTRHLSYRNLVTVWNSTGLEDLAAVTVCSASLF